LLMSGRLRLARREADKAIVEFERMEKAYPRLPQVHYQLALAHLLNNDVSKTVASLTKALALDPNNTDAALLLAEINIRCGNADTAITALTQLIKQHPQIAQSYVLLADAQKTKGDLDAAVAAYRALMEAYPQSPQAPLLIGLTELQREKKMEARR